jgi:hypothetical protein
MEFIIPSFIVSRAVRVGASLGHSSRFRSSGLYSPRRPSVWAGGDIATVDMERDDGGLALSADRGASVDMGINGTDELSGLAAERGDGGGLSGRD